jgi:hypothetical protein
VEVEILEEVAVVVVVVVVLPAYSQALENNFNEKLSK